MDYITSTESYTVKCNCNCNWGTCIAPPTRRKRVHHRVNPYPGACRQNETEIVFRSWRNESVYCSSFCSSVYCTKQ